MGKGRNSSIAQGLPGKAVPSSMGSYSMAWRVGKSGRLGARVRGRERVRYYIVPEVLLRGALAQRCSPATACAYSCTCADSSPSCLPLTTWLLPGRQRRTRAPVPQFLTRTPSAWRCAGHWARAVLRGRHRLLHLRARRALQEADRAPLLPRQHAARPGAWLHVAVLWACTLQVLFARHARVTPSYLRT